MGPAHSTVINDSSKRLCVLTFNNADLLYTSYNCLYLIEPGESVLVEAQPDAIGLKLGLVYDTIFETKELLFQRFACKNDSVLTISELDYDDVSWFGENVNGYVSGKLKERLEIPYNMACDAVNDSEPTVGERGGRFEKVPIKRVEQHKSSQSLTNTSTQNSSHDLRGAEKSPPTPSSKVTPPSPPRTSSPGSYHDSAVKSSTPSADRKEKEVPNSVAAKWEENLSHIHEMATSAQDNLSKLRATQATKAQMAKQAAEDARHEEKKRLAEEAAEQSRLQRVEEAERLRRIEEQEAEEEEERRRIEDEEGAEEEERKRRERAERVAALERAARETEEEADALIRGRKSGTVTKTASPDSTVGKLVPKPKAKKKAKDKDIMHGGDEAGDGVGKGGNKKVGKNGKKNVESTASTDDGNTGAKAGGKKGKKKGKGENEAGGGSAPDEDDQPYVNKFVSKKEKKKTKKGKKKGADEVGGCGCSIM